MKQPFKLLIFYIYNGPKYFINWILKKIFNFHPWHVSTLESRPYCIDLINYTNMSISQDSRVVELGCGLGETLAKIKCKQRYGYDTSKQVLKAAKLKNYFNSIEFIEGSFENIRGMSIDYLIAVNFLHDFDSKQVKTWFRSIISNNCISNIIIDELTDDRYFCLHKFNLIIPKSYKNIYIFENSYNHGRSLKVFSKQYHNE